MEQNTSINVTESAQKRIQNLLPEYESNAFRVYVTGGGCSGFQYGFKFDSEEAFDDDVIDFGHFRVLLDSLSYPYLYGSELDYVSQALNLLLKTLTPRPHADVVNLLPSRLNQDTSF